MISKLNFFENASNQIISAGLYFDGKEGTSLARIGRRNDFVREETYAIVGYPGTAFSKAFVQ